MILVTGGSGFIGSHLAKTLFEKGESVRIFDINDFSERPTGIEFFQGDICDKEAVRKAMENINVVFHCVALVPLMKAEEKFWKVNVEGTDTLLLVCREHSIRHFVHLSSSAVFGVPDCPVVENSLLRPVEIYGKAKLAGENLVKEYIREGNMASIIRPRTVLGNFRLGIFHILFEWISEGRTIYLIGNGQNLFQFIHVDDLIDAMIECSRLDFSGTYNIGAETFGTLQEDIGSLIKRASSKSTIKTIPSWLAISSLRLLDKLKLSPLAPWHYLTYHKPFYFDIKKERTTLHWKPKYTNAEMLWSSYQWFLHNKSNLEHSTTHESPHHKAPKQRLLKLLKWLS